MSPRRTAQRQPPEDEPRQDDAGVHVPSAIAGEDDQVSPPATWR